MTNQTINRPVGADGMSAQPLFTTPIRDFPSNDGDVSAVLHYEKYHARDLKEGTATVYGTCRPFCEAEDGAHPSVDQHGPFCESFSPLYVGLRDIEGGKASLYGSLAAPYLHGVYLREEVGRAAGVGTMIMLSLIASGVEPDKGDAEAKRLVITSAKARSLAAALVRLADEAEMLTQPISREPKD